MHTVENSWVSERTHQLIQWRFCQQQLCWTPLQCHCIQVIWDNLQLNNSLPDQTGETKKDRSKVYKNTSETDDELGCSFSGNPFFTPFSWGWVPLFLPMGKKILGKQELEQMWAQELVSCGFFRRFENFLRCDSLPGKNVLCKRLKKFSKKTIFGVFASKGKMMGGETKKRGSMLWWPLILCSSNFLDSRENSTQRCGIENDRTYKTNQIQNLHKKPSKIGSLEKPRNKILIFIRHQNPCLEENMFFCKKNNGERGKTCLNQFDFKHRWDWLRHRLEIWEIAFGGGGTGHCTGKKSRNSFPIEHAPSGGIYGLTRIHRLSTPPRLWPPHNMPIRGWF